MTLLDVFKSKLVDRKRIKGVEKSRLRQIRQDASEIERIEFEKNLVKGLNRKAVLRARKEAEKKVGIAKLRAERQVEELQKPRNLSDKMERFRQFRLRNLQRREENMERTKKIQESLGKTRPAFSRVNVPRRKPFEPRGFGR